MIEYICSLIILLFSIILFCCSFKRLKNVKIKNYEIEEENAQLEKINTSLKSQNKILEENRAFLKKDYQNQVENLNQLKETSQSLLESQKKLSQKAYENYCDVLMQDYENTDKEWEEKKNKLQEQYKAEKQKIQNLINQEEQELQKIKDYRAAAQEAIIREQKIKEKRNYYCLPCSAADRNDIQTLERVKKDLNKPRVLSMLIWSNYFQKPMTSLCANILGTSVVTGIYKITNLETDMCYIGQGVDVAKRFKEHAKCGLGIDTPAGNKLYKAMQEYGIWNFSWELLEQVPREQLNEKEKYYIDLYQSYDYGYNSQRGNQTKE